MKTQMIRADEIMTQQLTTTNPNTHVVDAIERLIGREVSGLPVIDSKRQLLRQAIFRTGYFRVIWSFMGAGHRTLMPLRCHFLCKP